MKKQMRSEIAPLTKLREKVRRISKSSDRTQIRLNAFLKFLLGNYMNEFKLFHFD